MQIIYNGVFVKIDKIRLDFRGYILEFAVSFFIIKKDIFCVAYLYSLCYNTDILC